MGELLSQAEIEALLSGQALPDAAPDGGQPTDTGAQAAAPSEPGADTSAVEEPEIGEGAGDGESPEASVSASVGASAGANGDADELDDRVFIIGEDPSDEFSSEEIDALGEIGNISMGNSATTLFSLLSRKVNITTPKVTVSTLRHIAQSYKAPLVVVRVEYTEGLLGSNLLVLKESDVMVITDLMMGGDGSGIQGDLTDLHLSAISEAMNQMIGNASTSLSNVFEKKIDISPPNALSVKINDGSTLLQLINIDPDEVVAVVAFEMIVEELLDTMIMQILPLPFAKDMINNLMKSNMPQEAEPVAVGQPQMQQPQMQQPGMQQPGMQQQMPPQMLPPGQYPPPPYPQQAPPYYAPPPQYSQGPPPQYAQPYPYVNVQPANFQAFEDEPILVDKKNIGLVMDVNLEVSVELGRTHKLIREILEFGQGSIIELDKLAGEPVDILVNGKHIAKGEVVVIDESFGVRVTDIIHPSKRI